MTRLERWLLRVLLGPECPGCGNNIHPHPAIIGNWQHEEWCPTIKTPRLPAWADDE